MFRFCCTPLQRLLMMVVWAAVVPAVAAEQTVRFNRDIRPILTDKCFACHGPDQENSESDLRLDLRELAVQPDGAIVPGDPGSSELVRRIMSTDVDELMPPPSAHKPLQPAERELLQRWISQGAEYEPHWAYAPLLPPAVPKGAGRPIDNFIDARLAAGDVSPMPEADRVTLIRRLSLDLTGVPPTAAEVDTFVNDTAEKAYETLVDRLLDSPRYGERMASYWLDLVRYADTVGYHGDQSISQSPYRDYVINSFNANMPYDRFVREQLAGDLLANATIVQQVASGYNRLHQTTQEGGAQDKEYRAIYFSDRVRNVSQVYMGATMGCAQCHDHKYDPYTLRDFYSLGAFFADLEEMGVYGSADGRRPPDIRVPSNELKDEMTAIDLQIDELKDEMTAIQSRLSGQSDWESSMRSKIAEGEQVDHVWVDDRQDTGGNSGGDWSFGTADHQPVHSGQKSRRQQADGLIQHLFDGAIEKVVVASSTRFYAWVYLDPENPPTAIMLQLNDGSWEHRVVWGSDDINFGLRPENWEGYQRAGPLPQTGAWVKLEVAAQEVGLSAGAVVKGMAFTQFGGLVYWDRAGWLTDLKIPEGIEEALAVGPSERTKSQAQAVAHYYKETAGPILAIKKQIADLQNHRKGLEESAPLTVVSKSVEPRVTRVLARGDWMDDSGEIVGPAIPEFLGRLETGTRRPTRLDLANWLCKPDNPLTSRTMVNRLWGLLFGRGICSSVDDLGGQGTYPSHPDLLDWLAVEFVDSGWDVKHLLHTIVTSKAYRRSSKPSEPLREKDPYNSFFARQGRFRIEAEMVRDAVLATSGLLVEQVGGPSVKPYQPTGYYAQLNFPKRVYVAEMNSNQYRRGVYMHWQRTFLHPMLKAFDAPSREECTAARFRSNTPLQALTLLNDPSFVEAARAFAARIMREGGTTADERIAWAYRQAVSRRPETAVAAELKRVYELHLAHYREHQTEAKRLISTGNAPGATNLNAAELAAWTSVARIIFNLHETIMRY